MGHGHVGEGQVGLFRSILPPSVGVAEVVGDDPRATLLPEEEAALGRAAEVRRRHFALGRTCARRALAELGLPPASILPGPQRAPCWPDGVVGSITHCRGFAAAAVAPRARFVALGIDVEEEQDGRLPSGVLGMVSTKAERAWLANLGATGVFLDRVLFSAKESVFKAWYPLTGRWLGFDEAEVSVSLDHRTFRARLLVEGPRVAGRTIGDFHGHYLVAGGFVLTAVTIGAG